MNRLLSGGEVAAVDGAMNDHMHAHVMSNSPLGWTCDPDCRRRALRRAINGQLTKTAPLTTDRLREPTPEQEVGA